MGTQARQHGTSVSAKQVRKALHQQSDDLRKDTIYGMGTWTPAQVIRLTGGSPCVVRPSYEGMMARISECYNILADSRSKANWRDRHLTVLGMTPHGYRVFALVEVNIYCYSLMLLMDAKTGTFYDATTGACKTSDNEGIDHIVIVDDVKPYLRANAPIRFTDFQWGNTKYGRNY